MTVKIKAGLVGFGTIGGGVAALLERHAAMLHRRGGVDLVLERIADVDIERPREIHVDPSRLTRDYREILADPEIDIVIELVGGTGVARDVVRGALEQGKHVVTANKALLCQHQDELFALATKQRRELRFEASVAGGIPIVKVLTESLAGDRVRSIHGIVNGTTNFILTRMIEEQWSFANSLAKAQALGFAEADPTLDVNGGDATHKLAILAAVAFNARVERDRIFTRGIDDLSLTDVLFAKELGYVIKLLAIAKQEGDSMSLRVGPTLIPERCSLASVRDEFNGVMLRSDFLGESLYVGRGAGAHPTATAIVSDVCDLARSIAGKQEFNAHRYSRFNDFATSSHLESESRFYLRLGTIERPGILAEITRILGDQGISISAIIQKETASDVPDQTIPVVILTRRARAGAVRAAADEIDTLEVTRERTVILPVEDLTL